MSAISRRVGSAILTAAMSCLLASCAMPDRLHVTQGENPKYVDQDVRFRTTYYYRVFDYCASANIAFGNGSPTPIAYTQIIPNTDALYRYRMTGKASAIFTKIRFESGVLKAWQIDPWGARTDFKAEGDPAYSPSPVGPPSRASTNESFARFEALIKIRAAVPDDDKASITAVENAIASLLQAVTGLSVSPVALKATVKSVSSTLAADLVEPSKTHNAAVAAANGLADATAKKAALDAANAALATATAAAEEKAVKSLSNLIQPVATDCATGFTRQRGFPVLGPEGMRTFNPQDRLIMAVSFDAKPLIQTLQEYSDRILRPKSTEAERLLPLARENLALAEARRAADAAKPADAANVATIFDAAITKLSPPPKPAAPADPTNGASQ